MSTQPPLLQSSPVYTTSVQSPYTQLSTSQPAPVYMMGAQSASVQGHHPLYNLYVGGAGHVALDPLSVI